MAHASYICCTGSAPTNIATIKYWGKADAELNTPINSSVSVTLSQDDLKAHTTVFASPAVDKDRLWLNGVEEDISRSKRVQRVLEEIRARCGDGVDSSGRVIPAAELRGWKVHIVSRNTFPTAAGLASSAAGYACLVAVLARVYAVKETFEGELSTIARQGSGSACRSLYGGFVRWEMGGRTDISTAAGQTDLPFPAADSKAIQIADESHWPELAVLIAVVSDKKKDTGSTDGMKNSVATSTLLGYRATSVVPARLAEIETAYRNKDFDTFAKLTMQDSNQFHAVCMDSYPPIFYMNDTSRRIIGLVHAINAAAGRTVAGYTFDAGPNAVIYTLKQDISSVLAVLLAHFPADDHTAKRNSSLMCRPFVSSAEAEAAATTLIPGLTGKLACAPDAAAPGSVRHIYVTSVGDGPRVLPAEESLIDVATGLPTGKGAVVDAEASACL